jgi:hypothetical protein
MGNAHYTVYRNGQEIEAGYNVPDVCNLSTCTTEIDRGAGYLCGSTPGGDEHGCGYYFCEDDLYCVETGDGETVQVCEGDRDRIVARRLDEFADQIAAAVGDLATVKEAAVLADKPELLVELDDGFQLTVRLTA